MSDADDQMGGHGGETGKDPAEGAASHENDRPEDVAERNDEAESPDRPSNTERTGGPKAAANRDNDPPA